MKEFTILKFLDKISIIFKSMGIDYAVMRKILQIKFLMDARRVPTVLMDGKNRESKNSFRSALGMYILMGIFIGLFMIPTFPLFLKMNVVIGIIIFMIMTTMISDFSAVLLDVKEKNILLSRPVDARTLSAAKLIHIIVYLFSITMAIAGGALIIGLMRYGIMFFLLFLLEIILICGFLILVTALFYYAVITVFNGEKLKDIINYFQIVLTIFMTIMYQFTGRIFSVTNMNFSITPHLWHFLLPSSWFAAPFILLMEKDFNPYYIFLSLTGIIVPIITITVYIKVVAPRFERKLQKLNNGGGLEKNNVRKESFQRAVSHILCHNPLEKVFFRFTLQMLDNERKLKLRIYPSLAFSVIFPFIFFLNFFSGEHSFSDAFKELTNGRYYLYLYFTVALLAALFPMISLSENYKGAWIYKALPVDNPVMVIKGAFKAFLIKYIVPIYLFISLIFIILFGLKILPSLALIFLNLMILMLIIFQSSKKELPFYKDFQYTQNGSNVGMVFFSFALCAVAAGAHYLALVFNPYGLIINIAISLIIAVIIWYYSFKFSWKDID